MARGFKVFDVYGELHLDRDEVGRALRGVPAEFGPDADRAGRELGDRLTRGLEQKVETLSARLTKARREESKASDALKLAELRLSEAREKGGQKASALLALEQRLTQAQQRLNDAQSATVTTTDRLGDAQRRLAVEMDNLGKNAGPNAERSGRELGGKLSQGIHLSIVRNSPLIAAAIGAGLAAGAPIALTAATGLFAGIGIVAAAQSDKVQSAWLGTWHRVRDGAIEDAAVIEPVLVKMASRVGDGFDRMRPRLRGAFEDAAPQIELFTDGILDLAENALPGLTRAVQEGEPVTRGFADFLGKTGQGLSDFFDRITTHAPAAGRAWSQLGDTVGTLLPLVGEFVGQGVELATVVLPLLNGSLGMVLTAVTALGPALPVVVTGFMGLKTAQAATGWVGGLVEKFNALDTGSGRIRGGLDKVSAAMTPVNVVTGALALTAGLLSAAYADSEQQTNRWAAALNEGGRAAAKARQEMEEHSAQIEQLTTGFLGFTTSLGPAGTGLQIYADDVDKAREAHREYLASLTPVERAQRDLQIATDDLSRVLDDENATTAEVSAAKSVYRQRSEESKRAEEDLELAIHGVTQAMIAQADQAFASLDSGFAYQNSLDQLEDRQKELSEAIRDHGKASEEADDATRAFGEGLLRTAQNFGQHQADLSGLEKGTAEYARVVQTQALAELYRLRDAFPQMAGPINGMIERIEAAGVSLDELDGATASPTVNPPNLRAFGTAISAANSILSVFGGRIAIPQADMNLSLFAGAHASAEAELDNLDGRRPTPSANLNTGPLSTYADWATGRIWNLNNMQAHPWATLHADTGRAEALINWAARNRTAYISVVQQIRNILPFGADGGDVASLPVKRFAFGGKIQGPGGPRDDRVLIPTTRGPVAASPTEWIVNAMSSGKYGDRRMAAVNDGTATILLPGELPPVPRFAGGGPTGRSMDRQMVTQQPNGTVIHIGQVTVQIAGNLDPTNPTAYRQAIADIRDAIRSIERSET